MVMPREERPPYISFELRSIEDRAESIARGHWVGKDIVFVIITPQGSKDRIERVAEEWFVEKAAHVAEQRFPRQWLDAYRQAYQHWLRDEEPPVSGWPIRNWPVVSPSQYKLLRDLRVLTVEDLAQANEETLTRIGPGARALKSKAEEWLKTAAGLGMQVEDAERLRVDNENLRGQVRELQFKHDNLAGQLQQLTQRQGVVVSGAELEFLEESGGPDRS